MAFDINKFRKQYKKMLADNLELTRQLEAAGAERSRAVNDGQIAAVTPLRNEIRDLKLEVAHARTAAIAAQAERDRLADVIVELERAGGELRVAALLANQLVDQWQKLYEDQAPAVKRAEQAVIDLNVLIEDVKDQMRRRERADREAILNRAAIAELVPSPNRR